MISEFRDFLMRGNVIDLAVGIIIGAAFTTVVDSLVNDILMPPIGFLIGGVDFSNLAINLGSEVTINYGLFINALIQFLIVGLAVFFVVRAASTAMDRFKKAEELVEEDISTEEKLVESLDRLNSTLERMQN